MNTTRRHFLMGSLASVGTLAATRRSEPASAQETVVVGMMGLGGRGAFLAQRLAKQKNVQIAWLADPDRRRLEGPAKGLEAQTGKRPQTTHDFRALLDDKSVDAIVMATPDHWHALGTVLACQANKDVYVEKPTCHSIWEGRKMVEAARKYQRVVQVGTQNRSAPYVQAAVEYLRAGKLGDVHYVRVFNSKLRGSIGKKPDEPAAPAGVDYDMWLGPARSRPFNENQFHYAWHWFWEYSGGDIINDGVHQIDVARWFIDRDYPQTVYSSGGIHFYQDDQETPDTHLVIWEYDRLTVVFEQTLWAPYMKKISQKIRESDLLPDWPFCGTRIELYGTKNQLFFGRHGGGWQVFDADGKSVQIQYGRPADDLHIANFLDCVRTRKTPNADIERVHLSTLLCHYGNISYRTGRKLRIDPKTEAFVDDAQANALVKREYRSPWVVPEEV